MDGGEAGVVVCVLTVTGWVATIFEISLSGSFMMRIDARRMMLVEQERSMGMLGLTLGGMIRY